MICAVAEPFFLAEEISPATGQDVRQLRLCRGHWLLCQVLGAIDEEQQAGA
jgi:hypothetical protein